MKKIIIYVLMCMTAFNLFAQCPIEINQLQLNAGVGATGINMVPVYVGLDYGVYKDITVGANVMFGSSTDLGNLVGITANGDYHFNDLLNISTSWDLYAGLGIGYDIWSYGNSSLGVIGKSSSFAFNVLVGGRYYFSKHWGINAEFGGGNDFSGGNFGMSYRF